MKHLLRKCSFVSLTHLQRVNVSSISDHSSEDFEFDTRPICKKLIILLFDSSVFSLLGVDVIVTLPSSSDLISEFVLHIDRAIFLTQ